MEKYGISDYSIRFKQLMDLNSHKLLLLGVFHEIEVMDSKYK
jgi:hypothetical protein